MMKVIPALLAAVVSSHATKEKTPVKFGVFSEECFATIFEKQDFSDFGVLQGCAKFSFLKSISYLIIIGALFFKLP